MDIVADKRPWGHFERFTLNEKSTVKLIYIETGKRLSYQYHNGRSEFWKVVSGEILVTIDGKERVMKNGDTAEIPAKSKHRINAITESVVLEIAFGDFNEDDIVRVEDDFGRK